MRAAVVTLDLLSLRVCLVFAAILGVHTLVTSSQTYDGTGTKEGYNSEYDQMR